MSRYLILILSFSIISSSAFAQEEIDINELITISTPLTINLEEEEELPEGIRKKKKKRKRNTYYGVKTKKGFTRNGFGEGVTLELFYFLKEPQEIDNAIRDIYYYDYKRRIIRKNTTYNPEEGALLHGPYKKIQNGMVLDSGVYYLGKKHGTWMYHDRNDVLVDKEKYYMGWPRESLVRYYDRERKKMREIIPVEFGEREGYYYYFFNDGRIAVRGEYRWGHRVGDWTEYYTTGSRKKIIRYPKNPFAKNDPLILREWNRRGRVVYDNTRVQR